MRLDITYFTENDKKNIYFGYCSLMNLQFIGLIALFMLNNATGVGLKKKKKKKNTTTLNADTNAHYPNEA